MFLVISMFCWYERENRVCFFLGLDDEDEGMFMICCDSIFGGKYLLDVREGVCGYMLEIFMLF